MIAYNNIQHLVEVREKKREQNLGQTGQNWAKNEVFHHFVKTGSLVFLEFA